MPRLAHSILVLCLALAACGQRDIVPGVSDSAFVATMADLRPLQVAAGDTLALAKQRQQILQQRGLTAEQLIRAGHALAADPDRATALFQAIDQRVARAAEGTRGR